MPVQRRSTVAFSPACQTLDTRLAPSGNFLTHGFADVTREVKSLEHHHTAEHSTATGELHRQHVVAVHHDHIVQAK